MKRINKEELHEIFVGIKDNSELEFNNLCQIYRDLVYGVAFSVLKNKEDSEEIVQIVFMKIYNLEKNKLPSKNEANWLYSLTKNETISFFRKKKSYIDLENLYEISDKDDEIDKITDKIDFNRLISRLNDKEKEIVSLKIISNLSFNQIARLLNQPINTVKWRYYKAVHTLELLLGNFSGFIITFVIGIRILFIRRKGQNVEKYEQVQELESEDNEDSTEEKKSENHRGEDVKKQEGAMTNNTLKDDIKEDIEGIQEGTTNKEETTVIIDKEVTETNSVNALGVATLSLSLVFLIITVFILVFFTKYQLKLKSKMSK